MLLASFLVGATQKEIEKIGIVYPEDPTLVNIESHSLVNLIIITFFDRDLHTTSG